MCDNFNEGILLELFLNHGRKNIANKLSHTV